MMGSKFACMYFIWEYRRN